MKHYPWIMLLSACMVLFGPMLVLGRALFWGTPLLQFVPWRDFAFGAIRNGHFPLWNPLLGMGAPLFANYQIAILYPPNILLFITGSAWGHGLLVALHVVWAGFGMISLARRLGWGMLSQSVAALAFSLSGYLIARSSFLSINAAVAWLPWIILAVDRLAETFSRKTERILRIKAVLILAIVLAMQWLAGHAQTSWYSLCLMLVWCLWRGAASGGFRGAMRAFSGLIPSAMMAFCLSAVQLLPTLEYLAFSQRAAQVERDFALSYSFWPWRFLGLLAPDLFGNPGRGEFWGYANYWEDAIYIGILPLILAGCAVIRSLKSKSDGQLGILLLAVVLMGFLLGLGKNTPVFPFLFDHIPTFNLFQAPTRWNLLSVFCLALLAGKGAELWQEEQQQLVPLFWVRLGTVGACAAGIVALMGSRFLEGIKESLAPALASAAFLAALGGAIAWRRRLRPSRYWEMAIVAFVAFDLLWAGWALVPSEPLDLHRGESRLLEHIDRSQRIYMPADVEDEIKYKRTHSFDTYLIDMDWRVVRDAGLPNTPMLDGISSVNNFDPILPERYRTWMQLLEKLPHPQMEDWLAFMDVGWRATLDEASQSGVRYVRVSDASRARLVGRSIWVEDQEQALDIVFNGDFKAEEMVVLEGVSPEIDFAEVLDERIEFAGDDNPNLVSMRVSSDSGGWLVLSDTYFPGWQAQIDRANVDLYPANGLFRAIYVPSGEHHVVFQYRPISFGVGAWLSLFALLLMGIVWWRSVEASEIAGP